MTADPGGGLEDSFTLTNGRLRGSFTPPIERHKLSGGICGAVRPQNGWVEWQCLRRPRGRLYRSAA
jgi:hypothetical protein